MKIGIVHINAAGFLGEGELVRLARLLLVNLAALRMGRPEEAPRRFADEVMSKL